MRGILLLLTVALGCDDAPHASPAPSWDPPLPASDAGTVTDGAPGRLPVMGGTMHVLADDRVIVADPDRDVVRLVDMDLGRVSQEVALPQGAVPFRVAEDGSGRLHVTAREDGSVFTIELGGEEGVVRREVCAAPRGIAWDRHTDLVHVACADGRLVSMPSRPSDGGVLRTVELPVDLRDVVVDAVGTQMYVSRFRSAEVLVLDTEGAVVETMRPLPALPLAERSTTGTADPGTAREADLAVELRPLLPGVAWRMRALPDGGVAVLHQRASTQAISALAPSDPSEPAYGGAPSEDPCTNRLVLSGVTVLRPGEPPRTSDVSAEAVLPVDFVHVPAESHFVVLAAGNAPHTNRVVIPVPTAATSTEIATPRCVSTVEEEWRAGELSTAIGVDASGRTILFAPDHPGLFRSDGARVALGEAPSGSAAFVQFHTQVGTAPIACASCHPEGGEDGHTWFFGGVGLRRTQTTAGGIASTAPFHWSGDVPTMHEIVESNMLRMGHAGPRASDGEFTAFIDAISAPPPPRAATDELALRGATLFDDACASCHAGDLGTDGRSVDVGAGEAFQIPHLVSVAYRAPFMHDGCAATLEEVLTGCAERVAHHGAELDATEVAALIAYLETR